MNYEQKYLKYKAKYLALKAELEGGKVVTDKHENLLVNLEDGIISPTKNIIYLIENLELKKETTVSPWYTYIWVREKPRKFSLQIYSSSNKNFKEYQIHNDIMIDQTLKNIIVTINENSNKNIMKKYYGEYIFEVNNNIITEYQDWSLDREIVEREKRYKIRDKDYYEERPKERGYIQYKIIAHTPLSKLQKKEVK